MTSKIDGYKTSQQLVSSTTKGAKGAAAAKSGTVNAGTDASDTASTDQVTLTQNARNLQKVAEAVANTPVVHAGKVEEAKLAINSGTYKIDATRVADKMLQFEKFLK